MHFFLPFKQLNDKPNHRTGRVELPSLWPDDFTDQDGGQIKELEEETRVYHINYDNAHFRRCLLLKHNEIDKKVVTAQY